MAEPLKPHSTLVDLMVSAQISKVTAYVVLLLSEQAPDEEERAALTSL